MLKLASALIAVPLLSLVASCSSTPEFDELAGESSADDGGGDGKADAAVDGAYTYYSIVKSGSSFSVARVNRSTTTCADGSTADVCTIGTLDWSESGLGSAQQDKLTLAAGREPFTGGVFALARGRFAKKTVNHVPTYRFVVTEAWVAEGPSVADGVYVRIKDNGVRCITAPCPSTSETALNTSRSAAIADIDFSYASLTDTEIDGFAAELANPSGYIIVGDRYTVHQNGHTAKGRTATAAYHRLAEPVDAPCFRGGCSGQVCSDDEGVVTTCQWRPEYACYQDATCARQDDGTCGFTQTPALDACVANALGTTH